MKPGEMSKRGEILTRIKQNQQWIIGWGSIKILSGANITLEHYFIKDFFLLGGDWPIFHTCSSLPDCELILVSNLCMLLCLNNKFVWVLQEYWRKSTLGPHSIGDWKVDQLRKTVILLNFFDCLLESQCICFYFPLTYYSLVLTLINHVCLAFCHQMDSQEHCHHHFPSWLSWLICKSSLCSFLTTFESTNFDIF